MPGKAKLLSDFLFVSMRKRPLARSMLLVLAGVLLIAAGAQVHVPMYAVPITLQSLSVMMIGIAYGARLASITLAVYALLGALGVPVLADFNSGFMIPSFGYVLGFIPAGFLLGLLAERRWDRSPVTMFPSLLMAATAVYIPGLIWLSFWVGADKTIEYGLKPFVINDLIEMIIASLCIPALWRWLDRRYQNAAEGS